MPSALLSCLRERRAEGTKQLLILKVLKARSERKRLSVRQEREGERSIYCSYTNATSFHYKMIIRLRWWWLYPRLPCLRVSLYKYACYVRRDYRRFKYALDKRHLVLRLPKFTSINCCYVTINCYCLRYTDSSDRYFIGVKKVIKRWKGSRIP